VSFGQLRPSDFATALTHRKCTVLAQPTHQSIDGNCVGIAHVPDGFFTFEGNGPLSNAKVSYWGSPAVLGLTRTQEAN
jgi:hypothetical protein